MKNLFKLSVFLILWFYATDTQGQNLLVVDGGDIANDDINISYSIGQVFYKPLNQSGFQVIQGIHNPFATIPLSNENTITDHFGYKMELYPNPVAEELKLKIDGSEFTPLWFQLIDSKGNILYTRRINQPITSLSLLNYSQGLYALKVFHNDLPIKTIKIIKI